jgi:hypothetical protein
MIARTTPALPRESSDLGVVMRAIVSPPPVRIRPLMNAPVKPATIGRDDTLLGRLRGDEARKRCYGTADNETHDQSHTVLLPFRRRFDHLDASYPVNPRSVQPFRRLCVPADTRLGHGSEKIANSRSELEPSVAIPPPDHTMPANAELGIDDAFPAGKPEAAAFALRPDR